MTASSHSVTSGLHIQTENFWLQVGCIFKRKIPHSTPVQQLRNLNAVIETTTDSRFELPSRLIVCYPERTLKTHATS